MENTFRFNVIYIQFVFLICCLRVINLQFIKFDDDFIRLYELDIIKVRNLLNVEVSLIYYSLLFKGFKCSRNRII